MNIVFVLFPNVTQLDLTGPLQVLSRLPGAQVHLVAASLEPVPTDTVLSIPPTCTFADCPPVDVICIPGGYGVDEAMRDESLIAFVRRSGVRAKYVTSVCTGAFILGIAGLLNGRRATTHWAYHDQLGKVGAVPVKDRVVRDGNLITGGGVTAGIDFALTLAAEIAGDEVAQSIQLSLEYDPAPPFGSGGPDKAPAGALAAVQAVYARRREAFGAVLDDVLERRGLDH